MLCVQCFFLLFFVMFSFLKINFLLFVHIVFLNFCYRFSFIIIFVFLIIVLFSCFVNCPFWFSVFFL